MWINVPSTISRSVPVARASTLDLNWLSGMFAQSVVWNTKPLPSKSWRRQWSRVAWMKRLYGRICSPLTAACGVALWIRSLRATRVSHSASLAVVVDDAILGTFGRTSAASLAKLNRASCFSKTCPTTSASDSGKSSASWRKWVLGLRRDYTARKKLARARSGKDSSSWRWPTPCACDHRTPNSQASQVRGNKNCSQGHQLNNFVVHSFHLAPEMPDAGGESLRTTSHLPRLNPRFVCWLMGWPEIVPIGSGFSATEWSRFRQRMRSALCGLLCDTG